MKKGGSQGIDGRHRDKAGPLAGRVMEESGSVTRKPSGPVIYTIEKGADVWPTKKQPLRQSPRR